MNKLVFLFFLEFFSISFMCTAQKLNRTNKAYFDSIITCTILEFDSTTPINKKGTLIIVFKGKINKDTTLIAINWRNFSNDVPSYKYLNMDFPFPIFSNFPFRRSLGKKEYQQTISKISKEVNRNGSSIFFKKSDILDNPTYLILFNKNKFVSRWQENFYLPDEEDKDYKP
jgi:hypothetical protein